MKGNLTLRIGKNWNKFLKKLVDFPPLDTFCNLVKPAYSKCFRGSSFCLEVRLWLVLRFLHQALILGVLNLILLSITVPYSLCFSAGDNPITEKVYLRTSWRLNKFPFPIDCKTCLSCIKYDQNVDQLFALADWVVRFQLLYYIELLQEHVREMHLKPNLIQLVEKNPSWLGKLGK